MSAIAQETRALAQPLHGSREVVRTLAIATLLTGCPSLTVEDADGGVNSPPAIISITADDQVLSDSGSVTFTRGVIGAQMVVTLRDTDVDDTLYVGMFVNYTVSTPTPSRADCTVAPTGSPNRTCQLDITAMCPAEGTFFLTVQVFDRALADDGVPRYKRMVGEGGLSTNRSYSLECNPP